MSAKYSSSRRGPRSRSGHRSSTFSKKSGASSPRFEKKAAAPSLLSRLFGWLGFGKKTSSPKKSSLKTERAPRPSRKPLHVEVTGPRLYVGNLSFDATESDLFELFSGIGQVQNVELVSNKETHRSKGFGFVQMTSVEEAKRAVIELHDKEYMGRKLVVSGAKAIPESRMERSVPAATSTTTEEVAEKECCGGNCHCEASEE